MRLPGNSPLQTGPYTFPMSTRCVSTAARCSGVNFPRHFLAAAVSLPRATADKVPYVAESPDQWEMQIERSPVSVAAASARMTSVAARATAARDDRAGRDTALRRFDLGPPETVLAAA